MKINIKTHIEALPSITLTVPDNATVDDLKIATLIALPSNIHSSLSTNSINLWYSGIKLDYAKPLAFYKISPYYLNLNPNLSIFLTTVDDQIIPNLPNFNSNYGFTTTTTITTKTNDSAILDDDTDACVPTNEIIIKKSKSKSRSKSKSKKCSFLNCTSTPLRMVGDCQFCQGKFCSKHRLLESHNCSGLKVCKDKSYERNALKLQSEQTVASKV